MRRLLLTLGLLLALPAVALAQVHFTGALRQGPTVRPSALLLSVDGTLYVGHMRWSSWGGATARGTGRAEYHGCTPSCAQATPHYAAARVTLSGVRTCRGERWYSRVTLYTRRSSGAYKRLQTPSEDWAPC